LRVAWFGSSLVSAYWNGAATYYRGIVRALAERGHRVTFLEPDAYERQQHRDLDDPAWAEVIVYQPEAWEETLERARGADVVVKSSGIGVLDTELEAAVLEDEVELVLALPGEGGEAEVFFSDLSEAYVSFNSRYTT